MIIILGSPSSYPSHPFPVGGSLVFCFCPGKSQNRSGQSLHCNNSRFRERDVSDLRIKRQQQQNSKNKFISIKKSFNSHFASLEPGLHPYPLVDFVLILLPSHFVAPLLKCLPLQLSNCLLLDPDLNHISSLKTLESVL